MYEIVDSILNRVWLSPIELEEQFVSFICGALIIIFFVVIVDLVYRVFSHFWK